jgi:hypothetical protein
VSVLAAAYLSKRLLSKRLFIKASLLQPTYQITSWLQPIYQITSLLQPIDQITSLLLTNKPLVFWKLDGATNHVRTLCLRVQGNQSFRGIYWQRWAPHQMATLQCLAAAHSRFYRCVLYKKGWKGKRRTAHCSVLLRPTVASTGVCFVKKVERGKWELHIAVFCCSPRSLLQVRVLCKKVDRGQWNGKNTEGLTLAMRCWMTHCLIVQWDARKQNLNEAAGSWAHACH